jgi:hypothetical protein
MLIKDPNVHLIFKTYSKIILSIFELNILKRFVAIETLIELDVLLDFGEKEHQLTLPEKLFILPEKINDVRDSIPREPIPEYFSIIKSKT